MNMVLTEPDFIVLSFYMSRCLIFNHRLSFMNQIGVFWQIFVRRQRFNFTKNLFWNLNFIWFLNYNVRSFEPFVFSQWLYDFKFI